MALLLVGVVGTANIHPEGGSMESLWEGFKNLDFSILNLTILAFWAFVAFEYVCPMVEETKKPEKNIPRSMISWGSGAVDHLFFYDPGSLPSCT